VRFTLDNPISEARREAELVDRLKESVRLRMIAEVPLGAFLSGGVDSSAVVAMMAGHSAEPVNTCSIAFSDPAFDEFQVRAASRAALPDAHFVDRVESDDFGLIDVLARTYDEPYADSSALPTYRVCQLARRHVTVALSGDGGDESFAGYRATASTRWRSGCEARFLSRSGARLSACSAACTRKRTGAAGVPRQDDLPGPGAHLGRRVLP